MVRSIVTISVLFAAAALMMPAAASSCYRGSHDDGELTFRGEAEGNRFQGRFREFQVAMCPDDDDSTRARIEVEIRMASATVGNRQGDRELLGSDLFFTDQFPVARWISQPFEFSSAGEQLVEGELNLRGIKASQPVRLDFADVDGQQRLSGGAEIERLVFDVGQGEFADPEFISPLIELAFELILAAD